MNISILTYKQLIETTYTEENTYFCMSPKKILQAKFEAKPTFEARPKSVLKPNKRPKLGPGQCSGQARPMGPGQVL
jgi:hypothetical protein